MSEKYTTDLEIIRILLEDYKTMLVTLSQVNSIGDMHTICIDYHMLNGLCYYAKHQYNIDITSRQFIRNNIEKNYSHWCERPTYLFTKESILNCFVYRIRILEMELNKLQ